MGADVLHTEVESMALGARLPGAHPWPHHSPVGQVPALLCALLTSPAHSDGKGIFLVLAT